MPGERHPDLAFSVLTVGLDGLAGTGTSGRKSTKLPQMGESARRLALKGSTRLAD
jgi:hypothetical protein